MRTPTRRTWRLLAPMLALTLIAAACGSSSKSADPGSDTTLPALQVSVPGGSINGTGSSFQDPFNQAAIEAFADAVPGVSVTYNAVGSGQGKKDFAAGLNNFAGTDSLAKDTEIPAATTPYLYVPTVAAPITVSYNLSGVAKLQLSAATLAGIFQRTIKTWDDAAIKTDNPGVTLPSTAIVVAHRSDGSGTTNNFTKYLTKAAGSSWTLGTGDTVSWPADEQSGAKNGGVAQIISSTNGAIGYVDLADAVAAKLVFASIKNKSGAFVAPTLDAATAALAGATLNDDGSYDPLDTAGAGAYPITSPTYLIVHTSYTDAAKGKEVKAFVSFLLNQGQDLAKENNFAKLSDNLLTKAKAQLDKVTTP